MIPTSTCPFTPVGTPRNSLCTLLHSSASSSRRVWAQSVGKLRKAVVRQSKTLNNLLEATGSRDTVLMDVDIQARKVEIEQTQQMLQESQKQHNEAIAKTYEQLRNLLYGDSQSQWDHVCHKMHERDLWAGVNGQVTKGRRMRTWMSFQDCLELHKLTVVSADAAKRQRFYIQQVVRKPQRATVQQHIFANGSVE
jgi:hypothetical protein